MSKGIDSTTQEYQTLRLKLVDFMTEHDADPHLALILMLDLASGIIVTAEDSQAELEKAVTFFRTRFESLSRIPQA